MPVCVEFLRIGMNLVVSVHIYLSVLCMCHCVYVGMYCESLCIWVHIYMSLGADVESVKTWVPGHVFVSLL